MTRTLAIDGGQPAFPDGLPLVRPRFDDVPAVMSRLEQVLTSGQLTNGRNVAELEERLAERLGVPHVVAVGSCTAGLMLVYQALGVRGDVVMPSHTFSASAHAVVWAGAQPRFADIEPTRATLDPVSAEKAIEGATAISATHIYGHPAEVEELESLAGEHGIPLVFDSAHALGSLRGSRPIGGFGTAEVFSMSPTKVTVAGEGGIVATRDPGVAEHVQIGRNYGNPGDYNCRFPGLNARMSELHAVLALASLEGLDTRIAERATAIDTFEDALSVSSNIRVLRPSAGDTSTFKDMTLHLLDDGADAHRVQTALNAEGVDSRRYFWPPIHHQDAYARDERLDLPVTDTLARRLLTVPLTCTDRPNLERLATVVREVAASSHS
ncbi:MAG: DegT/DnrJ/EryC1/StrS family aminotransferase [Actinomycetes bacterium]